ncbi:MAG TPA: Calx-beta domain-containing protein [Methylomirabilota bacterium]|nr:Calx-beta domain-containing protein [Methylomirabilota bacterium]
MKTDFCFVVLLLCIAAFAVCEAAAELPGRLFVPTGGFGTNENRYIGSGVDAVELTDGDVVLLLQRNGATWVEKLPFNGSPRVPFTRIDQPRMNKLLALSDGSFVAARSLNGTVVLTKYSSSGEVQRSFSFENAGHVSDMIEAADGGIIVGVTELYPVGGRVLKVKLDGSLDQAFSIIRLPSDKSPGQLVSQSAGRFVLSSPWRQPFLTRHLAGGEHDRSFQAPTNWSNAGHIISDNKDRLYLNMYMALPGEAEALDHLVRLHADGSLDRSFKPQTTYAAPPRAVLSDGSLITSSTRLLSDGTPDLQVFALLQASDALQIGKVLQLRDGTIVLAGLFNGLDPLVHHSVVYGKLEQYTTVLQFKNQISRLPESNARWELTVQRTGDVSAEFEATPEITRVAGSNVAASITPTTLRWEAGQSNATVQVRIEDDTLRNAELKTVRLTIKAPVGVFCRSITLVAEDDDPAFNLPIDSLAAEEQPRFTVRIPRPTSANVECSIDFRTEDGSAVAGSDFAAAAGTLWFGPDESSKDIILNILNDVLVEGDESFKLVLFNPTGSVSLGRSETTITIDDNEDGYAISPANFSENEGVGLVKVERLGDFAIYSEVQILAEAGTARTPQDFVLQTPILNFAPGQKTAYARLTIVNDTAQEGHIHTALRLVSHRGGVPVSSYGTAYIQFMDNERGYHVDAPTPTRALRFTEDSTARIRVSRIGDYDITSEVAFSTVPLEYEDPSVARAGLDFPVFRTNIVFAPGEQERFIDLPLPPDGEADGERVFQVLLESIGQASLPSEADFYVKIDDEDVRSAQIGGFGKHPVVGFILGSNLLPLRGGGAMISGMNAVSKVNSSGVVEQEYPLFLPMAIGVDSEGRLIAFGLGREGRKVYRFRSDGAVDLSFEADDDSIVNAIRAEADGKVLIASSSRIVRFLASGLRDPEFHHWQAPPDVYMSVVKAEKGPLYVTSSGRNSPLPPLARLNANGTLDTNFVSRLPELSDILGVDSTGRLLFLQRVNEEAEIAHINRLTLTGELDASFSPIPLNAWGSDHWLISGDTLYIARSRVVHRYEIERRLANGQLDDTFGIWTLVLTSDAGPEQGLNWAESPDEPGRILIWGPFTAVNGRPRASMADLRLPPASGPVALHSASVSHLETNGLIFVRLVRGNTNETLTLDYHTADGSARAGLHYDSTAGSITFKPAVSEAVIHLIIKDDAGVNHDRTVQLIFSSMTGAAYPPLEISIANDDPGLLIAYSGTGSALRRTGIFTWESRLVEFSEDLKRWFKWADFDALEDTYWLDPSHPRRFFRLRELEAPPAQ